MDSERIEIVECMERVERVERIQRVIRVASSAPRAPSPAGAEVIDIDARESAERGAPRGLVLNGVWVPLAR